MTNEQALQAVTDILNMSDTTWQEKKQILADMVLERQNGMTLDDYQEKAMTTCKPESKNFAYMLYGFLGEVGELVEKVAVTPSLKETAENLAWYGYLAKVIRDHHDTEEAKLHASINEISESLKDNVELQKEVGDVFWELNGLVDILGWKSSVIHQQNLDKLASRKLRDKIGGSGDNR